MKRLLQAVAIGALLLGSVVVTADSVGAATTVTDLDGGITPEDLVAELLGPGISASNVTYSGVNGASGLFEGAAAPIGFDRGVVLSSGSIADLVPGPNESDGSSTYTGSGGDDDLNSLINGYTNDKAVLEFDFTISSVQPTVDLTFDYVFGSEEYNEYVNSSYNDVFGFFVDGENCATVGDPSVPVSINTINNGNPYGDADSSSHPELYRNNDLSDGGGTIDTELDGLTTVLTCSATVSTGGVHRMKLAIADASDSSLDSAVFLRAGSFTIDDSCGEDGVDALHDTPLNGVVSGVIHSSVEPVVGGVLLPASGLVHDVNCDVVVPIEGLLDGQSQQARNTGLAASTGSSTPSRRTG